MTDTYNMHIETAEGVKPHGFHLGTQLPIAESFVLEALRRDGVRTVALYLGHKLHKIYDYRDLPADPDSELHAALEARGYVKEHNGGGTFIYRKGNIVVSGSDGDLPSLHWFMIGLYADWLNGFDCIKSWSDWSALPDYAHMGGPLDIWACLQEAESMEGKGL